MIMSCEKCNKKFEVKDDLIPIEGRLLQCGICRYQWHFTPSNPLKLQEEVITKKIKSDNKDRLSNVKKRTDISEESPIPDNINQEVFINQSKEIDNNKKTSINFLNLILVGIISFVALILILETFQEKISILFPNIDLYLLSLYEVLKDVFLFISDIF